MFKDRPDGPASTGHEHWTPHTRRRRLRRARAVMANTRSRRNRAWVAKITPKSGPGECRLDQRYRTRCTTLEAGCTQRLSWSL